MDGRRDKMQQDFMQYLGGRDWQLRNHKDVLRDVNNLQAMARAGLLGGSAMPEDAHPAIDRSSALNYHYFTLTMALNYQRDSYALWRCATATMSDPDTAVVFEPGIVVKLSEDVLREKLLKHKLALQQNRHPAIWRRVSSGIVEHFGTDIRNMFLITGGRVSRILSQIQEEKKKSFPYLSGAKICHYWLYVMEQYTDVALEERHLISVAPDTHVIKATCRLGLVSPEMIQSTKAQGHVTTAWQTVLEGTGIQPIDVHTRLWLWSRAGFPPILEA